MRSLSWTVTCEGVSENERITIGRKGKKLKPEAQVGFLRGIPKDIRLCETCKDDRFFLLLLTSLESLKGSRHQLPVWAVPTESTGPHLQTTSNQLSPGNGINTVVSWVGRTAERRPGGGKGCGDRGRVAGALAGERALRQRSLILATC